MPGTVGRKEIVDFLISRKFPLVTLATLVPGSRTSSGVTTLDRIRTHEEVRQYQAELAKLSIEKLHSLYDEVQSQLLAQAQREEEERFFNQPYAAADFDHWAKAEHWTLDEAIALALGKAPEIVSWERINNLSNLPSPFLRQYGRLRDLAERAKVWKKLFDPVLPTIFLKWACDNEIAVPKDLAAKVARLKGKHVDWKEHYDKLSGSYDQLQGYYDKLKGNYDELQSMYDRHIADWKGAAQKQSDLMNARQQRIESLEADLAAAQQAAGSQAKTQSPVERQNMLKTIYVMAVRGYTYDPAGKRSGAISDIISDMALEGLPLSEDTVRRYLKEAKNSLLNWKEES